MEEDVNTRLSRNINPRNKRVVVSTLLFFMTIAITGCANTDNPRDRYTLPFYATLAGSLSWNVSCGGTMTSGVNNQQAIARSFYKLNGRQKTLGEYCAEIQTGARLDDFKPRVP